MTREEKAQKGYDFLVEQAGEDVATMLWNWLGADTFEDIYECAVKDEYIEEEPEEECDEEDWPC